jgi:hypothetical protein
VFVRARASAEARRIEAFDIVFPVSVLAAAAGFAVLVAFLLSAA